MAHAELVLSWFWWLLPSLGCSGWAGNHFMWLELDAEGEIDLGDAVVNWL